MNQVKGFRRANGDGTVYFNKSKEKWISQINYTDIKGNKKRKSFSGNSRNEVIEKKNRFLEDNSKGLIPITDDTTTLYQILQGYYDNKRKLNLIKISSYIRAMDTLKIIGKSRLGNIPICKIQDNDIILFLSSITHYADSYIKKFYDQLNKGFKLACECKIIYFNPMDKTIIQKPKSQIPTKKVRALTVDEQNKFLLSLKLYQPNRTRNNYQLQWLIELNTGLRMGEINALTPDSLDFKNDIIHVSSTVTRGEGDTPLIGKDTKTINGMRDVPMNKIARSYLLEALNNYRPNKYKLLFYDHRNDKIITTCQVNESFRRFCKKFDIPYYGQHSLRHTFATRCIESGVPAEVLSKWLGHKDISTTINTYCDIFLRMHNDSMDLFTNYSISNLITYDINENYESIAS